MQYNDQGLFDYRDDGFTFNGSKNIIQVLWKDINKLVAFKVDLFTTDEVRLDIVIKLPIK